jgi:hypothetical protein
MRVIKLQQQLQLELKIFVDSASATLLHPVGRDWNSEVNVGYAHIRHRVTKLHGKPTSFSCRNVWTKVEDEGHASSSFAVHRTKG